MDTALKKPKFVGSHSDSSHEPYWRYRRLTSFEKKLWLTIVGTHTLILEKTVISRNGLLQTQGRLDLGIDYWGTSSEKHDFRLY